MRKLILALCAACTLSACVPYTINSEGLPAPAAVANKTKLDEQAAITANLAYKAWVLFVETGINAGLIKGQLAAHVADLDNQLYSALQAVDAAYAAGNSADYVAAAAKFNTILATAQAAIKGNS